MKLILKNIKKKCKECVKLDKKNKICSYYNKKIQNLDCIFCEFDQRKVCELCRHWDPKTCFCSLVTTNRFKDGAVLRICQQFELKQKGIE